MPGGETPITASLFIECPDIAAEAASVCNAMHISTVSVLESALEDTDLVAELLSRCVSAVSGVVVSAAPEPASPGDDSAAVGALAGESTDVADGAVEPHGQGEGAGGS
ncbi:hypothetical protein FOZ62_021695, partial [Perkinsus olseni]